MTQKNEETRTFGAEISKVLKLMIHSLYTNRDIFLRELVSNASDACDKLRYRALTDKGLLDSDTELKISISYDKEAKTLTIADNGIGMNREELITNLGTIAKSGTEEFFNAFTGDAKKDVSLIGQFGVGFYSSFMVASRVEVLSRKAGEETGHIWVSDGEGSYTIAEAEGQAGRGTRITLHLKEDASEYLDFYRLKHIIQSYSDHISFPIELENDEGAFTQANSGSALWMRSKADISPEQYEEFYRHVAHTPDAPWLTLHHKVEGTLEFTYLLFIPSLKPFDLFHPDRKRRVKLYIKRVFITDEQVDLIPHYLRFLRGVVDSEDLPLNISRETLQNNPVIAKIRDTIAKKVLSEIKKKAGEDPEQYLKFWKDFGPVIKEGLCEATTPKESILETCRFYSVQQGGLIGLDEYVSAMKEGQEEIFYLTGERLEAMKNNPQLEGFKARNIDVLLLDDHVDDFWLSVVQEYKGKPFKSISRSDIDLSGTEEKENASTPETPAEGMDTLISAMKEVLGELVQDVKTTTKLSESPAILSVPEGAMSTRLERFLIEQKQLREASAKVLEINPEHPIIRRLAAEVKGAGAQGAADTIHLLYEQACVIEGEEMKDPAGFARRLNKLIEKTLAA